MNRFIVAGLLALCAGCTAPKPNPLGFERYIPPIRTVQPRNGQIAILPAIAHHDGPATAVYGVSRKEGEYQLAQLARTTRREDAWVYLESDGTPLWIDVGDGGIEQKPVKTGPKTWILTNGASIEINMNAALPLLRKGDRVWLYHIHPDRSTGIALQLNEPLLTRDVHNVPSVPQDYLMDRHWREYLARKDIVLVAGRVVTPLMTFEHSLGEDAGLSKLSDAEFDCIKEGNVMKGFEEYKLRLQRAGASFAIVNYHVEKEKIEQARGK